MEDTFPVKASRSEMASLQRKIARYARFEDVFRSDEHLVGVDQAFLDDGDVALSAGVVMRGDEFVENAYATHETRLPYVPGYLAFREGPAVVRTLSNLDNPLDIVLVDGSGRIHPRQAGLATHVGVALDQPTVGVAKSLLCGELQREIGRLEKGERVPILVDNEVEGPDGDVLGYAVQTKQYSPDASTTVNPLYVSPGHRVSAETAVETVLNACDGCKLPEPIRRADLLADELK